MARVVMTVTPYVNGPAAGTVEWCDLALTTATRRRAQAREEGDQFVVAVLDQAIVGLLDRRIDAANALRMWTEVESMTAGEVA